VYLRVLATKSPAERTDSRRSEFFNGLLGPTRQDSRHEHFLNRLLTRGELARSGPASHFTSSLAILRRADRLVFGSFWGVEPNASPTARLHARSAADIRKNNPPAALRGARGSPKPSLPLLYDSTVSSRRGASASTILTLSASPHDGQTRASSPLKKASSRELRPIHSETPSSDRSRQNGGNLGGFRVLTRTTLDAVLLKKGDRLSAE